MLKAGGLVLGLMAIVSTAGLVANTFSGNSSRPHDVPAHHGRQAAAAPSPRFVGGVPVGYDRTSTGAKAAAANYVTVRGSSRFLTDTAARHQALAVMTTRESLNQAVKDADHTAARAEASMRGGTGASAAKTVARTGVLSEQVLSFDIHRAIVKLWTTTVRGNAVGPTTPKASFESVTVSLLWEKSDWKADSVMTGVGLTPPISTLQATNAAADFSGYCPTSAVDPVFSDASDFGSVAERYAHNSTGVQAAAANNVVLQSSRQFFTDASWRHQLLAAITAPTTLDSVTQDADSTAQLIETNRQIGSNGKTADGSSLVTRTAVLATRTITHSDEAASVELWVAALGGLAGPDDSQGPQVSFTRMNVDLTWVDDTWKVLTTSPGEPLVPSVSTTVPASPAAGYAGVGGESDAAPLS